MSARVNVKGCARQAKALLYVDIGVVSLIKENKDAAAQISKNRRAGLQIRG